MAIRKDANTLTSAERTEFVNAVKILKSTGIYDQFVLRHANAIMSAIHRAPAFLPWHRRFIWDFEKELQRVSNNPDLGLPYWNWPSGGENGSMWDDDLLGGNGDQFTQVVNSGPFSSGQWTIVNMSGVASGPLRRAFGQESWATELPTQQEINTVLAVTPYDVFPWNIGSDPSFRNQLEGFRGPNLHNRGHGWVGGSMLPMTSPNDPVFFMHHCMVDKLWYEWQLRHPNQGYLPMSGGPFGQNLNDPMDSTPGTPIGDRVIDVIDSAALEIEYDELLPGTPQPAIPTPGPDEPGIEIFTDGSLHSGVIGAPGEVDLYRFSISSFNQYTIETTGNSDTFLTLYGPDDSTQELAFNDDGGEDLNSRIVMNLNSGSYFARVRLFSASATGNYSIRVVESGGTEIPEISIDGLPLEAAISAQNESDIFSFNVTTQGSYTIETQGTTDTFINLLGPNSQTVEITSDDDSGFGRNSRISRSLSPGEYFVRVRHFSPLGTGAYSIEVSSN